MTYTIGEIADRSGFSASALRYYEGIGLVAPATRTDGGYRIYDEHTLARLAFIHRAKELGCSLDEISDLVGIWDGEQCGPVQHRFHELVTAKLADAGHQIGELTAFMVQLHAAAAELSGQPVDGPCDDGCACLSDTATVTQPLALGSKPAGGVPIACTLDAGSMPGRLAEWQGVLAHATARTAIAGGGLRLDFDDTLAAGDLARLVGAEQRCCAFFSFAITVDARGLALEVHAPDEATDLMSALFGALPPS